MWGRVRRRVRRQQPSFMPVPSVRRRPFLALAAALPLSARAEPLQLRFARFSATPDDPRIHFPLALLRAALALHGLEVEVQASEQVMERNRAIKELEAGHIDFMWSSLGREIEQVLRPVRIPIYRGLIGQRIFLIHREREAEFAQVRKLDHLAVFTAGQGTGWVDTQILQAAGLKVLTNTYDALFRMLVRGGIDYFPRGANEAPAELAARATQFPELMVEPRLVLSYRSDNVFFVRRQNEVLARQIESGLQALHVSGAYQRLFETHPYVQKVLAEARLDRRLRLEIPNPMLSDEDRLIAERYWM